MDSWSLIDVANWLGGLPTVIFVHAALTFPSGRSAGHLERIAIWAMYAVIVGFGWLLPTPLFRFVTWPGLVIMAVATVAVALRYLRASPAARRVSGPVPFVVMLINLAAFSYAAMEAWRTTASLRCERRSSAWSPRTRPSA